MHCLLRASTLPATYKINWRGHGWQVRWESCARDSSGGRHRRRYRAGVRGERCAGDPRSEEHTSELQSLMRSSYAVFCLKTKKRHIQPLHTKVAQIRKGVINYTAEQ